MTPLEDSGDDTVSDHYDRDSIGTYLNTLDGHIYCGRRPTEDDAVVLVRMLRQVIAERDALARCKNEPFHAEDEYQSCPDCPARDRCYLPDRSPDKLLEGQTMSDRMTDERLDAIEAAFRDYPDTEAPIPTFGELLRAIRAERAEVGRLTELERLVRDFCAKDFADATPCAEVGLRLLWLQTWQDEFRDALKPTVEGSTCDNCETACGDRGAVCEQWSAAGGGADHD